MQKSRIIFFIILIALSAAYVGGCRRAGTWLVKEDVPVHADAMVLLMGSFPERVLQAYESWKAGLADCIIIVEESMGPFRSLEERGVNIVSNSEQAVRSLKELGVPADSIILLPGDARSTVDEVVAIKKYLNTTGVADTLVLVSSPAHMRRASMIFRAALKKGRNSVYIGCIPSDYSSFNPDKWWRRKEDIQSVLSEFVKIESFLLFEKKKLR
jgi:uncharacterized SAM-binding protein YcdF (DUF218 family)